MAKDNVQNKSYNTGAGRYTGNGFIPAKQAHNTSSGCLSSLLVILLPAIGMGVYIALQVV